MVLIDGLLLTLNIVAIGLPVAMCFEGYQWQRRRMAVWNDRAPWLGPLIGKLQCLLIIGMAGAIYSLGYWLMGFPSWMRWLVG